MDDFLNFRPKLFIRVFCLIWLAVSFSATVHAQDMSINTPLQSTLESGMSESWVFIAREGQVLSFVAKGDNGLDLILSIEDFNGKVLISNDDYNYPDSRDALIEAFSAPYTGSYTLIVSAYGETSGNYELSILSGYSQIALREAFDNTGNWATVDLDKPLPPQLTIINGNANLSQEGILQEALAVGAFVESDVFYVHANISSISGSRGWETGIVFRYQDAGNYYQALVNQNGAWRMLRVHDGEMSILRNWNVHPAITPGDDTFDLDILVNGSGFDVFYDGYYIGSENDSLLSGGQVGLAIVTADALGSRVTARYDELLITIPTAVNNESVFPTQLIAKNSNYTLRELERRLLIPQGGEMAFVLPESFVQNVSSGVSRFPIGNGQVLRNFVLSTSINWTASGADLNGCGIAIRQQVGSDEYILAYIDSMQGYGLAERQGDEFVQNVFHEREESKFPPYHMLLIVNEGQVHYFLDGKHAASLTVAAREGQISEAIVNFKAANTHCQYDDLWVWQWP